MSCFDGYRFVSLSVLMILPLIALCRERSRSSGFSTVVIVGTVVAAVVAGVGFALWRQLKSNSKE